MTAKPTSRRDSQQLNWRQAVANYQAPDNGRSYRQLLTSIVPYFVLMALMVLSLDVSYWITLLLAIPAAGFLVRIFIILHDCGHGSLYKSRKVNDLVGVITGVITWTPYYRWRHDHAIHHATAADLDRRDVGDVWTMTVA